ncbi:MAG TPA: hypothetical protein HA346_03955 [Thermoplasmata archaeon]|nr:hypothetical protein [Thermoplasmata archaeon]
MDKNLKIFLTTGIPFGIIFGILMGVFIEVVFHYHGLILGLFSGLFGGLIFGGILTFMSSILYRQAEVELGEGEEALFKGPADLGRGIKSVGGLLYITDSRLLFSPHPMMQKKEKQLEIPLNDIAEVGKRRTGGIIPSGMFVCTKSGDEYRFAVWERKNLIRLLLEHRSPPS